jgi:LuxR family transcriptional regulator, maltose regulon positive regulatory protein
MISARSSAHLPGHVVDRDRLRAAIGGPGARIVVVTGPAGSGKTVAVRQWAATTPDPVAWLSLDSRHTDPEHFLDAVFVTLEELVPGVHEATFEEDPDDRAADRAVVRAVRHLAGAPAATIVLDDLHVIDRSPTTGLLTRLVTAIADTDLRLVICSRSDPPLPLHRFRLAGELVELRESDLRFNHSEAAEFFERFPEVDLAADQVERLTERTEGWAAGLQFAALSLRGRDDTEGFVERFAGSDRHVADFLLDEVLLRQPDDVREFLLMTSVLERLRSDVCAHVTGREDAGALLRRVESENLFVVPLDDEREWFRYHHLFAQLLRRELRVTRPHLERLGHVRAAEWCVANGQPSRAIDHHLDAGQLDAAFDLITTQLGQQLGSGRHETVRSWLARLPESFVDATPEHQLLLTLAYSRSGEIEVGRRVIERARARASPEQLAEVGLHYDVTDAAMTAIHGDPEASISLGLAAWARRDEVDLASMTPGMATAVRELWGYLPAALTRAYALLDDRAGVRRWAAVMRRQGPRLPSDLVGALGAEAWAEARNGRLRVAAELADEAMALGTEYGRGSRRAMIGARVTLAHVHRERDELDRAVGVLEPHMDAALREGHVAIGTLGEVELARVEYAQGAGDDAIARLLRTRRDRAARGTPRFLSSLLDVAECRLRLQTGDVDRAADLLDDIADGPERTLLRARAALAAGRPEEVAELLCELRAAPDDRRRWFEAAALSARAAAETGDLVGARRVLGEVAPTAQREGAVRTFLEEGFDLSDPTAAVVPAPALDGWRRPNGNVGVFEPLSERELSVLRYLPSRLSNREIGDELYVSLNTVKSHLKTIYRKLDVERRDDAVRRARQMGLI